jgi:Uma2 family endonuclease
MAGATAVKLGPADHGMPITEDDLRFGDLQPGFKYEIIDGRLYVSYEPDLPEGILDTWLYRKVAAYSERRPDIINFVHYKSRVFVPHSLELTVPEPDLAAYRDFPLNRPLKEQSWRKVSPILVGEILSKNDPHKDLVRNVKLYLQVPSIREYWIIDGRDDPDRPALLVHRRHGKKWRTTELEYGEVYRTPLLPGFKLVIDPRK